MSIMRPLHFFHRWTRWTITNAGPLLTNDDEKVGYFIVQTRTCQVCGLVQIREDRTTHT